MKERILKTMKENSKQELILSKHVQLNEENEKLIESIKAETKKQISKRELLKTMCASLLDKCYDHYLIHQRFIDEEQKERQKLSELFSERMKEVSSELEAQKDQRTREFAENQEWRDKIGKMIT